MDEQAKPRPLGGGGARRREMKSIPITWDTIEGLNCMACHEHPAARQVIIKINPQIELTPLVCEACSMLPESTLKAKVMS